MGGDTSWILNTGERTLRTCATPKLFSQEERV